MYDYIGIVTSRETLGYSRCHLPHLQSRHSNPVLPMSEMLEDNYFKKLEMDKVQIQDSVLAF